MSGQHRFDFCKQYLPQYCNIYDQDQHRKAKETTVQHEIRDEDQKIALRIPAPIFKKFTGLYEGQPNGNYHLLGGFGMRRPIKTKFDKGDRKKPIFASIGVSPGVEDNFRLILIPRSLYAEAVDSATISLSSKLTQGNGTWRQKYPDLQQELTELKSTSSKAEQMTAVESFESKIEKFQAGIERDQGSNIIRHFRPSSSAKKNTRHPIRVRSYGTIVSSERLGQPNHDKQSIQWGEDIPEDQNCALWVVGLPADVTIETLFDGIRGVGKIAATVIKPANRKHSTTAVKIVFFTRGQAQTLLDLARNRRFQVLGKVITSVSWNRIKSGPYPHKEWSRAIKTTGPAELMDIKKLKGWFGNRFKYQLDRVMEVPCGIPGKVSLRWEFGSVRCQSAWAKAALEKELPGIVEVIWVRDRCA